MSGRLFRGGSEGTWLRCHVMVFMQKVTRLTGSGRGWSDLGEDIGVNSVERVSCGWGCTEGGKSDQREKYLKALLVWETGRTWVCQQARDLFIAHLT